MKFPNVFLLAVLAFSAAPVLAAPTAHLEPTKRLVAENTVTAEGHTDQLPETVTAAAGVCNLQAIAFANQVFNKQANAQAKCAELVAQTGGNAADCKVVKQKNKFLAKFRKPFNLQNLQLNALLVGLENFLVGANIFQNAQIAVQAAVTNGCG